MCGVVDKKNKHTYTYTHKGLYGGELEAVILLIAAWPAVAHHRHDPFEFLLQRAFVELLEIDVQVFLDNRDCITVVDVGFGESVLHKSTFFK